jgi:hypothetical protein
VSIISTAFPADTERTFNNSMIYLLSFITRLLFYPDMGISL